MSGRISGRTSQPKTFTPSLGVRADLSFSRLGRVTFVGEIQTGGLANGGIVQKAPTPPIGPKKALSGEFPLPPRDVQRNRSQSAPSVSPRLDFFVVFHSDFGVNFCRNFPIRDTQTLENVALGKFHQTFTPNFTTPLAQKTGENYHPALLQGGCSERRLHV